MAIKYPFNEQNAIAIHSNKQLEDKIGAINQPENIKAVYIYKPSNMTSLYFGTIAGFPQFDGSLRYVLKDSLLKLSPSVGRLRNLQYLSLRCLGLNRLPDQLIRLRKLAYLDMSFNQINVKDQIPLLLKCQKLKVLKVFGCQFDESDIQLLTQKGIRVYSSSDELVEESQYH